MNQEAKPLHVICVCCGFGFPNGMAVTSRIKLFGRALLLDGVEFSVFHVGGASISNESASGEWRGIDYQYFPASTKRPANRVVRSLKNIFGLLLVVARISKLRRKQRVCVHCWEWPVANFIFSMLKVPVVLQENEWWPDRLGRTRFCQWFSKGSVHISSEIESRMLALAPWIRKKHHLCIPIMVDPEDYQTELPRIDKSAPPFLFWCGSPADAGGRDIRFMIEVLGDLKSNGIRAVLRLSGNFTEPIRAEVLRCGEEMGLESDQVEILGFITRESMLNAMQQASALLLPLWNDDERSICRFPTKLAEYLLSGTPVITAPLGDMKRYLQDDNYFGFMPSDVHECAMQVERVLRNPEEAALIGGKGRKVALEQFDYRLYSTVLGSYFLDLAR